MAERLAGGNVAIAPLGNTQPTAAILVVLITVFGPLSGALAVSGLLGLTTFAAFCFDHPPPVAERSVAIAAEV